MNYSLAFLLVAFGWMPSLMADDGKALFNGSSLDGWDGDPKFWSVQEGTITGQTTAENPTKGNTFLIYRGPALPSDFELEAEFRIVGGNSGIQYRSFEIPNEKWVVGGYQADFDAAGEWAGTNYGERFRGILAKRGQKSLIGEDGKPTVVGSVGDPRDLQKKIKKEDWNSYRVTAKGFHFEHRINGQLMSVVDDEDTKNRRKDGILALQLHAGPPMKVQFRKITVKGYGAQQSETTSAHATEGRSVPSPAPVKLADAAKGDGSGFLGIAMQAEGSGVVVDAVISGTPAEKAGLKEGDVIVAVDGKKFSARRAIIELQNTIKTKAAGEEVELELGGAAPKKLKVRLGARPVELIERPFSPELAIPKAAEPKPVVESAVKPTIPAPSPTAANSISNSREAKDAVAQLEVAQGLEATLFASEPMMLSPSNIDVDHRGRVWVAEIVNYRGHNGKRPEGDRILIVEDTNGDGQADSQKVFYQKPGFVSPHGICVLGNQLIVSTNNEVWKLTDENGDDKADREELMFKGEGSKQHDHTLHAFVFGPDGKLYFNHGNEIKRLLDKDGKPVVDKDGLEVAQHRKPYQEGMIFRCDMDGSNLETIAWNFRNNWEVCVDSFGGVWQSDNDDDGNRGVRINYIMEFGNYGRNDEMTGAGWQSKRTNWETEIPLRHWHLNDPGVVPNLLQTGAGSPTGITIYEGDLLPKQFRNQMIHCDPGPNVTRAYPVTNAGAGYKAEIVNILSSERDKWFRPVDPCVAPDGSLFVADWYDPGVGGHGMGDLTRGRVFRVAPPGRKYETPKFDFATAEGAMEALKSPNQATRYLAWSSLHKMGHDAEGALEKLRQSDNPRFKARALWLLGKIPDHAQRYVDEAIQSADPDIRMTGLRLARQSNLDVMAVIRRLIYDPSAQVRRECAIALRHRKDKRAADLWISLAHQHDGKDRWALEALGIGADKQWDEFFGLWFAKNPDGWKSPAGRDIIWRARCDAALDLLVKIIKEGGLPTDQQARFMRAFDFHVGEKKEAALLKLLE